MGDAEKTGPKETSEPETPPRPEEEVETSSEIPLSTEEEDSASPEQALEEKEKEVQSLNEKYLRVLAELENFKKRTAKDRAEQIRFGNEPLLKDFLAVLDNLERAIDHMKGAKELEKWVDGVALTHRQCLEVLKKFGVTPIKSLGEVFDPSIHQAVTYLETTDHEENSVAEELQKGYQYHDRILRPSMVAVARKPAETSSGKDEGVGDEEEAAKD